LSSNQLNISIMTLLNIIAITGIIVLISIIIFKAVQTITINK
jgi:hypothetical protein